MKKLSAILLVLLVCCLAASGGQLVKFASGRGGAMLLNGNYLYAVLDNKLCTYDVSSPLAPVLKSSTVASGNRQMVRSGKKLFLSCRSRGVEIFSLEDPAAPRKVNHFYPSELATGLAVSGDVLAVTLRIFGVEFFDVSDPQKVRPLGRLRSKEAQSAAFFGKGRIAVGDWGGCRVLIADVSDPSAPSALSFARTDGYADGVVIVGNCLYVATGMNQPGRKPNGKGKGNGLEIFDISNPAKPRRTGLVKFDNYSGMPDWWSVKVSGNIAFSANSGNGVYVVDVTDKQRPAIVNSAKIPGDSAFALAPGRGAVYVSGLKSGLYLFKEQRSAPESAAASDITLPAKISPPPEVPGLRRCAVPGFVWSLARWENTLYAACSAAGLKEFDIAADGSLKLKRSFTGSAMDCAVSEKLLIIAADQQLKIMDRSSGKILSSLKSKGVPFLQVRLFGDRLCTAGRGSVVTVWDISDPASPRKKNAVSGGGIIYGDMLPERSVNGIFPVNWHSRFVRWYDADGKEIGRIPALNRRSHQQNGITEINGKFVHLGRNKAYLLSPESPEKFTVIPDGVGKGGIPTSNGNVIAVSHRSTGTVSFYDFDGKNMKELKKRRISLPFTLTGRVVFYKDKAYIPAGLCGIYYE